MANNENENLNENKIKSSPASFENLLPKVQENFTFKNGEFLNEKFSIEQFVRSHINDKNLEQLRQDLSWYLRALRLSLIDLINEDYSDFVNLSGNLIGLDRNINKIKFPLQNIANELSLKLNELISLINELDSKFNSMKMKKKERTMFNLIVQIAKRIESLEKCRNGDDGNVDQQKNLIILERFTLELNEISVYLKRLNIDNSYLKLILIPKYEKLNEDVNYKIANVFMNSIETRDKKKFVFLIKIFKINDQLDHYYKLFSEKYFLPKIKNWLNNETLDKLKTKKFLEKIFETITNECDFLISREIINNGNDDDQHNNFNEDEINLKEFLLHTIWKCVCDCLILNTSYIFSSGDPDLFKDNYCLMLTFIENFSQVTGIKETDLRINDNYKELMSKFNLTIYYHIRYQQIVNYFESSLNENLKNFINDDLNSETESESEFNLKQLNALQKCINDCWSKYYLNNLLYSFFKLTLLLINRFSFWLEKFNLNNLLSNENQQVNELKIFSTIIIECNRFIEKNLNENFIQTMINKCPHLLTEHQNEMIDVLNDSLNNLKLISLENIRQNLINSVTNSCEVNLKQIADIPRIYRKTNRDLPIRSSNYVKLCMQSLTEYHKISVKNKWPAKWENEILENVIKIAIKLTNDVLLSVQKMEETLRRLKKVKNTNNKNISDDDKIRYQIKLDINDLGNEIERCLSIKKSEIPNYNQLLQVLNETLTDYN